MRKRDRSRAVMASAAMFLTCLGMAGCMRPASAPKAATQTGSLRERIARLALAQTDFGSLSLLPVRFESSRISGPFEDGGRTLYCVSSRMKGRTFDKAERPKVVIRDQGGTLTIVPEAEDVCEGHRSEPFPELDAAGNKMG